MKNQWTLKIYFFMTVFYDSSSSSDESVTQPLGKYYCSKRYRI